MIRDDDSLSLSLGRAEAVRILTTLELLEQRERHLDPALSDLRARLREALSFKSSGDVTGAPSTE